ncbi:MAG: type II secretion system F family protein [Candidatus Thermoplasmatota archaeon]
MPEETEKKEEKKSRKERKEKKQKEDFLKQLKIAYNALEDPKKFQRTVLFPLIGLGVLVFCLPFILQMMIPVPLDLNPTTFIIGGIVPIMLGFFYPFITWKNKEADINSKMHFFITHLRVLAISDTSLKDIIGMLGGNKAYGSLGEELRKISVLSEQWRVPLAKCFTFIAQRTPSKILGDFLDRFAQGLDSGVDHREFIETEQGAVLQEYKTMYESSNENIVILSEVYVSLLISIIFIMALGIVLPMIIGTEDMNTFIFLSSFLLIVSEGMLLYLIRSMVPADEIWHRTGEAGDTELQLKKLFKISIISSVILGCCLFLSKYLLILPLISSIPFEILVALSLTPLIIVGIKTFQAENMINRKERNFLSFLPSLGSIATMRGGRITASVYYLSEKDYGVLTKHIRDLYRRLRTRINDDESWEWFGIDTGSNHIQRSCEMFRQATAAAANPRTVSRMITENIRKIRDLRVKKLTVINTTAALFGGITFGLAFCIYTSLVIARHMNTIMRESMGGNPFRGTTIDVGAILKTVPPEVFTYNFIIIFIVLTIHCCMLALTLRTLRGSHLYLTLLYFVPFVWVVAVTGAFIDIGLGTYLGM